MSYRHERMMPIRCDQPPRRPAPIDVFVPDSFQQASMPYGAAVVLLATITVRQSLKSLGQN